MARPPYSNTTFSQTPGSTSIPTSIPTTNSSTTPAPSSNSTWWKPAAGSPWQIILNTALNTSTLSTLSTSSAIYDIDLFENAASTIATLHGSSLRAICYFSAGTYEDFRPDASEFQAADRGAALADWPGEWWLDTRSANVRAIMLRRLDLAVQKGCDGVDPDNIDAYGYANGFGLTQDDAVEYLGFLAAAAHARGLAFGLKNGGDILPRIVDLIEWVVVEQCVLYGECTVYQPVLLAGKPVFHIEYPDGAPVVSSTVKETACADAKEKGFSTVLKEMNLGVWVEDCWT